MPVFHLQDGQAHPKPGKQEIKGDNTINTFLNTIKHHHLRHDGPVITGMAIVIGNVVTIAVLVAIHIFIITAVASSKHVPKLVTK